MHEFPHIRPPSTHVVASRSVYYKGDLQKNILFGWTVVFLNHMNNDALIRASLWGKLLQKHILFGILKSEGSAIKMHMRLEFIILTPFASDSGLEEDAEPSFFLLYARPGCHKSTAVTGIWVQATFDSFQMEWQFSQLQDSLQSLEISSSLPAFLPGCHAVTCASLSIDDKFTSLPSTPPR